VVELLALLEINRVFVTVAAAITTTAIAAAIARWIGILADTATATTAMDLLLGVGGAELN